jgi:CRISPR type III-B/RAMP module-associated protein Cmr3
MTSEELITIGCYLHPLENLQFRDGRPLEAGFLHRSGLPAPQTLIGAIRAALMRKVGIDPAQLNHGLAVDQTSEDALRESLGRCKRTWIADVRLRGPWLVRHYPAKWNKPPELMLPLPKVLQYVSERKEWVVLRPLGTFPEWIIQGVNQAGPSSLWHWQTEPAEPVPGFLTHQALRRFLRPDPDQLSFEDFANHRSYEGWFATREDLVTDVQAIGIARELDRYAVEEGRIYAPGEVSFPQGLDADGRTTFSVSFYAEVIVPSVGQAAMENLRVMTFGGQGAEVAVEIAPPDGNIYEREVPRTVTSDHVLIIATSPVITDSVWPPALRTLSDTGAVELISACSHGVQPISGWDAYRRCPHPNRFAAPAGSCYFLKIKSNDPDQRSRITSNLESLASLCDPPFASHGWGTFAIGSYRPFELNFGSEGATSNPPKPIEQGVINR